jgi:riboflavin synthase|tara:strand:- start:1461 stop:2048 length:588 start_codon:yes stop_codon:yes gene_type:complete
MFNGIIFNTGKVISIKKNTDSVLICVETKLKFSQRDLGSSVCCDGICLTIIKVKGKNINFYISKETLKRSNFKSIKINQIINIEKSLLYGQKISGHFTQGHVDTVAKVKKIIFQDKTWLISLKIKKEEFSKFIVEKASISINGVSLTISRVFKSNFEINVIPHTLNLTNLKNLKINNTVNVELDIFSKYMYKYSN